MGDQRLLRQYRIRRHADFQRAYRRRCSVHQGRFVIVGCENGLPHSRLGLSVSRKVGNAVARNRWKRLLREAFRLSRSKLPAGLDLIVIPRHDTPPALAALLESFPKLAAQIARKLARTKP